MSHQFNEHRANKVMRNRVAQITGGKNGNGPAASHPSGVKRAAGGAVKAKMRADGGPVSARADKAPRRASGGGVKGKNTTVNVIISPQKGEQAPPPMAAMPPPPPPMPPKPPMAPPAPAPMGPIPGLGGMPPPMPHANGGRAYKKGGAVKRANGGTVPTPKPRPEGKEPQPGDLYTSEGVKRLERQRAAGGPVNAADQKGKTGIGDRTPVQHSGNKSDSQNIGRGPVVTRATGGPIYSDGKKGKQMAWLKGVGAGGGEGRLKKAAHAK